MSLTRNTTLASLTTTAAQVAPGMSLQEVMDIADQNSAESASSWVESMFTFHGGILADDAWLRAARNSDTATANALAWAARVFAEPRIAKVVEDTLAGDDGSFDAASFSTDVATRAFEALGVTGSPRKAASSLLNQAAAAPLFEPEKHGGAIIGAVRFIPTAQFVPAVVEFLEERIRGQVSKVVAKRGDAVELALLWKANRWFGLTKDEFRTAARPRATTPLSSRTPLPADLRLLHEEARRRKQVVLQGAPGTGKTFVAKRYVEWAAAGRGGDSNLSAILAALPSNERTPADVAHAAIRQGLTAVWDIAQFHPSYGYEDFVRTLATTPTANGVTFRAEHRVLSFLAAVAVELRAADSECDVILIVDEVNRADIARVFGELLYALEYRDAPVRTPYTVDGNASMTLPSNLILLGTMNTADRSIALIDYALRRRFTFITLEPDVSVIDAASWHGTADKDAARHLFEAISGLFTTADNNAALAVGHSYFLPSGDATDEAESLNSVARRFAYEVVPLLNEYAAEGLVDSAKLASVLSTVGVDGDADKQDSVEEALRTWLASSGPDYDGTAPSGDA
ncbi:McrB family protein [Microbacterium trichothecenolyticum]|uniref:5-methylcytosine-specific restriction enzyme B n=1 Tax=Microbacterium trichothecenolyticum TaxID=69370 RepID=A0A0M2HMT6_MICTR|nr:AAA family ATPase [Microbacterium trichothecenolyticum]KJL45766.1 5-methylcytosine-specific restriction enzyme B [Microbacterium trichothecenolyticum]